MKPKVLYHASSNKNITLFVPRAEKMRDSEEGPRVFATPSYAMATIFIVNTDGSWANSGSVSGVPYIVVSDEARFKSLDTGGAIYSLSPDTFKNDPNKGLGPLEWTSAESVVPTDTEEFSSGLDAMLESGVQVYFVDKETYGRIQKSSDYGISILNDSMSENQKRGLNVSHPL